MKLSNESVITVENPVGLTIKFPSSTLTFPDPMGAFLALEPSMTEVAGEDTANSRVVEIYRDVAETHLQVVGEDRKPSATELVHAFRALTKWMGSLGKD